MKYTRKLILTAGIICLFSLSTLAQDCVNYHEVGDCHMDRQRGFKVYSQSKSVSLSPTDTIDLNIIFYGQKDYIFSFCTHTKLYPIHFQIIDPETGDLLYDNKDDNYLESIGIGFDVTKSLTLRVNVLARKASAEEIDNYLGCLGLLIQYNNYPDRKKLKM
jgi:hypothetical protein